MATTTLCPKHLKALLEANKTVPHDHSAMMGHGTSHNLHDGMIMSFHGGYDEVILFDFWNTKASIPLFLLSCLALFILAALYEGLKLVREKLIRRELLSRQSSNVLNNRSIPASSRLFSHGHIIQTSLHMLQITVSYLLMLVFMTYNTWLCLSVVLGAGLGYFIFGLQRLTSIDVNEHCH